MDVGISLNSSLGGEPVAAGRIMIERARLANEVGLATLSVGDHHARPGNYFQNTPVLGRLLAEWDTRPAGCLFLLPLWNPVLVAEHIGTLAALHDGPFIVQTGVGAGADQFAAMGASLRTRGLATDEAIRVVKGLLAGETMSSGRFGTVDAAFGLRPAQPVEWWIGAGSARGLDRAAREADAWYAGPIVTPGSAVELLDRYRQSCADHEREPRALIRKDVLIRRDGAAAAALAADLVAAGYRGMGRDALIVGTPEHAAEQVAAYADLGFEQVVARCMNVPQPVALETIELLAEVAALVA
ncbi:MAG: LLM class flavin-dependent oxidoreductase [Acidimicrobiia bacterium]|nr:LLM class flavin-dependent oxidoreductase [Acidimicrobiia bacterium]